MYPPDSSTVASWAALVTWSSVTPAARSRSGSTSTWNCLSRWPQMATFATPGTLISFGRIVHRASTVISRWSRAADEMPIFITRLSDDSGCRMTGGRATAGSRPASAATRSCTYWRALWMSVPSWNSSTTDDSPSTDLDRRVFNPGVPFRAFSSGTLIRLSTSSVERPGASVCTSTRGGANSGNTSSGAVRAVRTP